MKLLKSADNFTKIFIITAVLIVIATPFIVNQYQNYQQEAARPKPMQVFKRVYWPQNPVEFQTPGGATQPDENLWVTNPTVQDEKCAWDSDDYIRVQALGALEPGETFTHTECVIADWAQHLIGVEGLADKNSKFKVGIQLSIPALGVSWSQPDENSRVNRIRGCILGPDYNALPLAGIGTNNPLLDPITGSANTAYRELGEGKLTHITWSITNTGSTRIRDGTLDMNVTLDAPARIEYWCGGLVWQTGDRTPIGQEPGIYWKKAN